ncbi:DUF2254 domain-containing protein [Qipengyuania atrilutea]|uniref:DUF2254 domain-containing protein n=1 Tax=Qipengyuania atrilutea TaxID=2744473 RepID=A0A850GZB2_9SPHN|nr:DUF2254 domain-containing protein [Actirhodobacter atriluteus]NVD44961.1 DUF2254 domain-containing protein [Actirhodobacter atriluteus]
MAKLKKFWNEINASYWFYPALFSIVAVLLAIVSVWLDRNGYADFLHNISWLEPARPAGASNMLTVIAGSMIGTASTVFSITIAAVAYASGNYGPRLLTNFMENKGNQLSLAVFIGTFVYAISVLRVVRVEDEASIFGDQTETLPAFVPQLSLLLAFAAMAVSVMTLVYFLNHIPASIRINSVLKGIGDRLINDIRRDFDKPMKKRVRMKAPEGRAVTAKKTGYVQIIDFERLDRIAHKVGGRLQLGVRSGDFVHPAVPLVYWTDDDMLDDLRDEDIRECFALGGMRTPNQDLHFLIDELVEIGLRALSPGINDPFTAISALHWLGAATAELGQRELSRAFGGAENDDEDRIDLLGDDFAHYVHRGFGSVRPGVATNPNAAVVMFEVLYHTSSTITDASRHHVLAREGEQLWRQTQEHMSGPDIEWVESAYRKFEKDMAR